MVTPPVDLCTDINQFQRCERLVGGCRAYDILRPAARVFISYLPDFLIVKNRAMYSLTVETDFPGRERLAVGQ